MRTMYEMKPQTIMLKMKIAVYIQYTNTAFL